MSDMIKGRASSLSIGVLLFGVVWMMTVSKDAWGQQSDLYQLSKRKIAENSGRSIRREESVRWEPKKTAVIVCDVWDYHHSINAVRRLEEMLPSMEKLLQQARNSGSVVIHAPSDCMPYYADHPARLRATKVSVDRYPSKVASWNCKTTHEQAGQYPLDQSDGGEDDDPQEHRQWADKLKELGRNPGLPWKAQNPALSIDGSKDYISDKGDEVWAILKSNQIEHVIMIGVHTNMCVLGRPFGLRQLVSNQVDVVLVRDLTDCMYNPKRWPYVDHFTGNDLMISYVEQFVCPTITSDQLIGGKPVVFSKDTRSKKDLLGADVLLSKLRADEWQLSTWPQMLKESRSVQAKKVLVRFSLSVDPKAFAEPVTISHPRLKNAWLNGNALSLSKNSSSLTSFQLDAACTFGSDDANVLVMQLDVSDAAQNPQVASSDSSPVIMSKSIALTLDEMIQFKIDGDQSDTNLALPAKFALPPAVFYALTVD